MSKIAEAQKITPRKLHLQYYTNPQIYNIQIFSYCLSPATFPFIQPEMSLLLIKLHHIV